MVFVSSDQDQHAFDEYWGSMPFLAVPYEKRDIKAKLGDKYGVRGIPSLIVLDSDGNVKDAAARGTVMQKGDDIKGALAAWA
jgi:nucleoredoxin